MYPHTKRSAFFLSLDPPKAVSFNLTIPTSTVDPISAPPLSRTVPPPSISIVPLDQLTALGTALFTQQQQKNKKSDEFIVTKSNTKIPPGKLRVFRACLCM